MAWEDRRDRIDEDDPEYLWRQVANDLRGEIESGVLPPGAKLPAEPELASLYGVARQTVRNAIKALREEGLIIVRFGKGTFVKRPK